MSEARPASAGIALEFSDPTMLRGGGIGKFIHPIALCRDGVIKNIDHEGHGGTAAFRATGAIDRPMGIE